MQTSRIALLVGLAMGLCVARAAQAAPIIPNTGATAGSTDPFWSVLWHPVGSGGTSFGSAANAPLVTSIPSPPWQPAVPGSNNWLGVNSTASIPGASGDGSQRYEYAFTTEVTLLSPQLVTGAIGYDNFFVGGFIGGAFDMITGVYTPGASFSTPTSLLGAGNENKAGFCRDSDGFLPSSSFPTCTVNFGFNLPAGTFDITFVIRGDGVTDAFFLNQEGVTLSPIVPEPASLTLLGIGLTGLGLKGRRSANRKRRAV